MNYSMLSNIFEREKEKIKYKNSRWYDIIKREIKKVASLKKCLLNEDVHIYYHSNMNMIDV